MSFTFAARRPRRRPSLTPMIDVVFLLLVFFMLAARFGQTAEITLSVAGEGPEGATWQGPPRLIEIGPERIRLNGIETSFTDLARAIAPLPDEPSDPIVLLPTDAARLQRLLDVMAELQAAGYINLLLAEAP